jgi:predicted nucleic acid binding AN1-type Zn finger protein
MPDDACAVCGKIFAASCKFCGKKFCSDHKQPDKHSCTGLEKSKEEKDSNYVTFMKDMVAKSAAKRREGEGNKNAFPT